MEDIKILSRGERLKLLRNKLNLKQQELAGKKFSKNYISMFENNKRSINSVNALYLARKINKIAGQRGKDINVTPSYFLKCEADLAVEKCEEWLLEVESNLKLSEYHINVNLYKTILISSEYDLFHFRGKALFLKGINSFNDKRPVCAMTQILDSIIYFARENNFFAIKEVYKNIGIILFNQQSLSEAIIFFNLCNSLIKSGILKNFKYDTELIYYQALCYHKLGQNDIAGRIVENNYEKSEMLMDLHKTINKD